MRCMHIVRLQVRALNQAWWTRFRRSHGVVPFPAHAACCSHPLPALPWVRVTHVVMVRSLQRPSTLCM